MRQRYWTLILLATCASCVGTPQTPVEELQAQASRQPRGEMKWLTPPLYMALKVVPKNVNTHLDLDEVEKKISPIQSHETAASSSTEPDPIWLIKVRNHARQDEFDLAMQLLFKVVREDSKNQLAWRELGRSFDDTGRRDSALSAWSQLLALVPNDVEALTAMGINYVAVKDYRSAAEHLFRARRLWLTVKRTNSRLKRQISTLAGLGFALRALDYAHAAAACFDQAAQLQISLGDRPVSDVAPSIASAKELLRFAGECEASIGNWDNAVELFSRSLAQSDPMDATSVPASVWALTCAGRPALARQLIMDTLMHAESPGRAGAPSATQWLHKNGVSQPLQAGLQYIFTPQDTLIARSMVACSQAQAARVLLTSAPQILDNSIALREMVHDIALNQGIAVATQIALDHVQKKPDSAHNWAAALRDLPYSAKQMRAEIQALSSQTNAVSDTTDNATRALLGAWFDLVGLDSLLALQTLEPFTQSRSPLASASRIAALHALAIEHDLAKIERIELLCDATSAPELAALARAFLECGETTKAIEWVERAIALDKKSAQVWMVRAAIDLSIALNSSMELTYTRKREAALESRNSLERAMDASPNNRLAARKYLEVAVPEQEIAPDQDAMLLIKASKSDQVLRELRREQALSLQRHNQSEFVLESLRMLLLEDPHDAMVARRLLSASANIGCMAQTEEFLNALVLAHPAAIELTEAALSCKAGQGRFSEVIDILQAALLVDPDSDALIRSCVRACIAAEKNELALGVLHDAPERVRTAAGRAQLERIDIALNLQPAAAAQEIRAMARGARLSKDQRESAVSLAHRLPHDIGDRLALQAALAKPLLNDPKVAPMYVAYAMLDGNLQEARAISKACARAWTVDGARQAAQLLADENMFMRAEYLLHDCGALNQDKNKSQLFRAELACLIAKGNVMKAIARLTQEREQNQFQLQEPLPTTVAQDLAELGNAFLIASDPIAAEECFQMAIDLEPNLVTAMNNLAWLRMERNDIDVTTIDLIHRALVATPNDPSTLDTAGWLAYRQGRLQDVEGVEGAVTILQRSLKKARDKASPESLDHCADALYRVGEIEQAKQLWRLIVDEGAAKSSRENVTNAFSILQQRQWGIRAWNANAFYDGNDGAAIARAREKLNFIQQGGTPALAPMDYASTQSSTTGAPNPQLDVGVSNVSEAILEGAK